MKQKSLMAWKIWNIIVFSLVFFPAIAQATITRPVSVPQMMGLSTQVFYGEVTRKELDWGLCGHLVTNTTFEVVTPVKGTTAGESITVTRFGVDGLQVSPEDQVAAQKVIGPSFKEGERYLVFFGPEGEKCGYNNPIALDAGTFREKKEATGAVVLENGVSNLNLFGKEGTSAISSKVSASKAEREVLETHRGPVDRDSFLSLLKKIAE